MDREFLERHKLFQREWLKAKEEASKDNEYEQAILSTVKEIIQTEDYSWLYDIVLSYDRLFKFRQDTLTGSNSYSDKLPFWKQNFS